jgi:hypothetical protein
LINLFPGCKKPRKRRGGLRENGPIENEQKCLFMTVETGTTNMQHALERSGKCILCRR